MAGAGARSSKGFRRASTIPESPPAAPNQFRCRWRVMRPKHAFFAGAFRYSPLLRLRGLAGRRDRDRCATLPSSVARARRRSWDSHPSQVCSRSRAAGASPRWPGPRAVGFTPPRERCPATVFVAADRAALERQLSEKGGRSNEVRYVMRRLLGFDSRLRSAAAGMKPSAAILPWAFRLSQVCRAHIRVRTRATARTIAPSPASATPSGCHPLMGFAGDPSRAARRPSSASDADASSRALRPPRHLAHDARDPQHIAGPFSVLRG